MPPVRKPAPPASQAPADQDRTGLLQRLELLGEALDGAQKEQLAALHRKIAAGEPIVLGPSAPYRCPHCTFVQPDVEFANGVIWRTDHTVSQAAHIDELHQANGQLVRIVDALEKRLKVFKAKAPVKRRGRR